MTSCYKKTYEKPNNKKISYTYDKEDNILTIYGKGKMPDYSHYAPPWAKVKKPVHIYIGTDELYDTYSGLKSVSAYAFSADANRIDNNKKYCDKIKTVQTDNSVEAIGDYAFSSSSVEKLDLKKPKKLGKGAFKNCYKLSAVVLPGSLKNVSEESFAGCKAATALVLNNGVEKIDKRAFMNCKKLTEFGYGRTLTEIGTEAFRGCDGIKAFGFTDYVRTIGERAFYDCKNLKTVYIPNTVYKVADKAFGYILNNGKEEKVKNFVIKGEPNSAAEAYAKRNGFKFIAPKTPQINYDINNNEPEYNMLKYFGFKDAYNALEENQLKNCHDIKGGNPFNEIVQLLDTDDPYEYDDDDEEWYNKDDQAYNAFPSETMEDWVECISNSVDFEAVETKLYKKIKASYRTVGDYTVSDYKDGVCINKLKFSKKQYKEGLNTITIPEKIDGKKVVKLGEYIVNESYLEYESNYTSKGFLTEFTDGYNIKLVIPKTVKYISANALKNINDYIEEDDYFYSYGYICDIEVDKANPYYTSESGVMYSKDKSWLLFFRPDDNGENGKRQVFTVPKSVKYIADTNICETSTDPDYTMIIGSNVKKIYAHIGYGECGSQNCKFKVAKGSAAEKWLGEEK